VRVRNPNMVLILQTNLRFATTQNNTKKTNTLCAQPSTISHIDAPTRRNAKLGE
jgi:hypothetical protein